MYLIIGANGFLGSYVVKAVLENTDEDILAVTHSECSIELGERVKFYTCDITDFKGVDQLSNEVKEQDEPVKVVLLAAYHNPDLVEKNPRKAWDVNITALSYLLNCLENISCLFYPSTDTVYGEGGRGKYFSEDSILNPVNRYGEQKVLAELMVLKYGYHVLRFPFLIGRSLLTKKKHFYDHIVDTISKGEKIEMYSDSYRSALDFNKAAKLMVELIEHYGSDSLMPHVINVAGDQALSKFDIGLMIAEKYNVSTELIVPILFNGNKHIFNTPRAESTLLDNRRIKEILGLEQIKIEL